MIAHAMDMHCTQQHCLDSPRVVSIPSTDRLVLNLKLLACEYAIGLCSRDQPVLELNLKLATGNSREYVLYDAIARAHL